MKYLLAIIPLGFLLAYGIWVAAFASSGVKYIEHDSKDAAKVAAWVQLLDIDQTGGSVIGYTGESNTLWSGEVINGYIILDSTFAFSNIQKRDFVVYAHSSLGLVCHSARVKNSDGTWILEGDGNSGPDNEFLTPDNYVGVMYNKTVWSY